MSFFKNIPVAETEYVSDYDTMTERSELDESEFMRDDGRCAEIYDESNAIPMDAHFQPSC